MSDQSAATGAKFPLALNGRTFRATPLLAGMWGEIDNCILARRLNVVTSIAEALESVPEQYRSEFIAAAVNKAAAPPTVTKEERRDFLGSHEGTMTLLWMMLRDDAPDLKTVEDVKGITMALPLPAIKAAMDRASGVAELKNS